MKSKVTFTLVALAALATATSAVAQGPAERSTDQYLCKDIMRADRRLHRPLHQQSERQGNGRHGQGEEIEAAPICGSSVADVTDSRDLLPDAWPARRLDRYRAKSAGLS
jgi:hypothetical protein